MKKTYVVKQTKNFEKGGTFLTYFIGEYDTAKEAMEIAEIKTREKLCEITVEEVETFASGSKRVMIYWQGIRAYKNWRR